MTAARAQKVRGCRPGRLALAAMAAGLLGGCAQIEPDTRPETGNARQAIIGGVIDYEDPAVVMVLTADGLCTGSLIAPRVVLTAAHCIERSSREPVATGSVRFGSGAMREFFAERSIVDMFVHRRYRAGLYAGFDIAAVRLDEPAPPDITPLPVNDAPLPAGIVGDHVRAVGFGVSDGQAQTGAGVKRTVDIEVLGFDRQHMRLGDAFYNVCQGDSGGPFLYSLNGVETIVGVTSFGEGGCAGPSRNTRVDIYVDEFLRELIAAWDGPCQADGACDPTQPCGEYPDPDCDVCGVNGICGERCLSRPDLDCPVAGLAGESCAEAQDCESRVCTPAPEDERVTYCARPCMSNEECEAPTSVCGANGMCRFAGETPGIQGAPCTAADECRSGICDPGDGICVEPCQSGSAACTDGFACRDLDGMRVCRLPRKGGCEVARLGQGRTRLSWVWLLALAIVLSLRFTIHSRRDSIRR